MFKKLISVLLILSISSCIVRPDKLTQQQASNNAQRLISYIDNNTLPEKYLSLYEVLAIGLSRNLEQRAQQMKMGLLSQHTELSEKGMLPRAAFAAGFQGRNNFNGIISTSDGTLVDSNDQANNNQFGELAVTWNILDFGVSYYKTKQSLNDKKVLAEIRRKSIQQLSHDIETAYWYSAMQQHFNHTLKSEVSAANEVLNVKEKSHRNASTSELEALIEMQKLVTQLRQHKYKLDQSRTRISQFLGVQPDLPFKLATDFSQKILRPEEIKIEHRVLLHKAFTHHPEIKKSFYENKNSEHELKKAWLRFFPGIEFNLGYQHRDEDSLQHQQWSDWGSQISWNLIELIKSPSRIRIIKGTRQINELESMALSLTIAAKLYITEQQYFSHYATHQYQLRNALLHQKLKDRFTKKANINKNSQYYRLINYRLKALMAEIEKYAAFVEMKLSLSQLYAAIGIDLLPKTDLLLMQDYQLLADTIKIQMQETQPSVINFIDREFVNANTLIPNAESPFPQRYVRYGKSPQRRKKMEHFIPPSNRVLGTGEHTYGIQLLTARGWYQYNSRVTFNGIKDLPYRIRKDGYRTYYHVYYKTFPDRQSAEQGLKQMPDFYQIFNPKIARLP